MIRQARTEDISVIVKNSALFWQEIRGEYLLDRFDPAGFSNYLKNAFAKEMVVGWIYEENKQVCGGLLMQKDFMFLTGKNILSEIGWWILPEKRNSLAAYKLIKEAEKFAKNNSFDFVMMGCMEFPRPDRLTKFYEKLGYKQTQIQFFKKIS